MTSMGPSLPPHLAAKRKRKEETADSKAENTPPEAGPARPQSSDDSEKRRRVVGPAPPPAPLDERPSESPEDDSSDDDDDYGPAPPSADALTQTNTSLVDDRSASTIAETVPSEKKVERDAWMTMPPQQDDLAARMDPTKLRARKFNSGKGAKAPNQNVGGPSDMWTETPEQKRKRLENQVMGISEPTSGKPAEADSRARAARDEETDRRIREHTEKTRGKSLYEQHRAGTQKEKEDDPSKRSFDWEKDMGSGMKIGHAQRKEMMNNASNFGSKFSEGSYL